MFAVESYQSEINQIVIDVFATMLALDVAVPADDSAPVRTQPVTAAIFFAGTWQGAVLLECSVVQACQWTAKLMSVALPAELNDDVRDAMGELVNMIGGNLKSVLPKGVGLSMPTLVQGSDYVLRMCGGNLTNRRAFESPIGPFAVTLIEVIEK